MEKKIQTNQKLSKDTEVQNYNLDLNDYLKDNHVTFFTKFLWWCCEKCYMIIFQVII